MSGQIRQNKATKEWVIYAPARGKRPHDFKQAVERVPTSAYDPHCPFCPGNEALLPPLLAERKSSEEAPGWQTRVVPNKYPALTPEGSIERQSVGVYVTMQGYGHHEVIIEHPQHDLDLARMPLGEVEAIIATYHERYLALSQDARNILILLFRNHGLRAGASLMHPHSQVITTGMVPRHVRWREDEAQRHFDEWGRCVYCEILDFESDDGQRIVFENDSFLAFVPYAAEVPFEIWIVPRRHQSDFGQISPPEQHDLAAALHVLLGRLARRLNDPDYNYIIYQQLHPSRCRAIAALVPAYTTAPGHAGRL